MTTKKRCVYGSRVRTCGGKPCDQPQSPTSQFGLCEGHDVHARAFLAGKIPATCIQCGGPGPLESGRCRKCIRPRVAAPKPPRKRKKTPKPVRVCEECGAPLAAHAKHPVCYHCRTHRTCKGCDARLGRRNASGLCPACWQIQHGKSPITVHHAHHVWYAECSAMHIAIPVAGYRAAMATARRWAEQLKERNAA